MAYFVHALKGTTWPARGGTPRERCQELPDDPCDSLSRSESALGLCADGMSIIGSGVCYFAVANLRDS